MAGYWSSSFLRVYGWRRSPGPKTQKKEKKYPAFLTEQAWSIKYLSIKDLIHLACSQSWPYSCFKKGCPTKPYATMPKDVMGNGDSWSLIRALGVSTT